MNEPSVFNGPEVCGGGRVYGWRVGWEGGACGGWGCMWGWGGLHVCGIHDVHRILPKQCA